MVSNELSANSNLSDFNGLVNFYPIKKIALLSKEKRAISGDGEIRTLVQTRKQIAFYTFSLD